MAFPALPVTAHWYRDPQSWPHIWKLGCRDLTPDIGPEWGLDLEIYEGLQEGLAFHVRTTRTIAQSPSFNKVYVLGV